MAHFRRAAKKLNKDAARQLAAQRLRIFVRDLCLQFGMKGADLVGQQYEVQQHIGVHNQENQRAQDEERLQRQIDIEEW